MKKIIIVFSLLFMVSCVSPPSAVYNNIITQEKFIENEGDQQYIKVINETKIYSGLGNYPVVAQAIKGDVFEVDATSNKWHRVFMFSGEYRYLSTQDTIITGNIPELPKSENKRKEIAEKLILAEEKGRVEAENKYPNPWGKGIVPKNWEDGYKERQNKLIDLKRVLQDRYTLGVCQKYNISTISHQKLTNENLRRRYPFLR